jgi:drug/metabolite transporter (DMT)-like permease
LKLEETNNNLLVKKGQSISALFLYNKFKGRYIMRINGYIDAILYVVITSITFVLLTKLSSNINLGISLFFMSGVAIICFNLLGVKKLKNTYKIFSSNWVLCIQMSIALGLDWGFMLFSSINSDPFIAMGSLFVALAILGFINLFKANHKKSNIFSIFLLILSLLLMACFYNSGNYKNALLGVAFGFLAGVSFYFYIILSTELTSKTNISSIQILSLRFWALFIGSVFFLPKSTFLVIGDKYLELIMLSLSSMVLPIFFSQQALQKLGPGVASVLFCFAPPITYLFYAIIYKDIIFINVLICTVITAALIIPKILDISKRN